MVRLKCLCCGHEQEFDNERQAFEAGWDAPPYFLITCCDLCPSSIYVMHGPEGHREVHERWKRDGRPSPNP